MSEGESTNGGPSEPAPREAGEATKESVDHLALRAPPRPVVRLNRRNLMIAAAVGGLVVFGAMELPRFRGRVVI